LTTDATSGVQQLRDLLECVWPAVLDAAGAPFRSASWCAALTVVLDRCHGDLTRVRRMGAKRFLAAVRDELPRWGATRPRLRIVTAVFDALTDSTGVATHRPGALERAAMVIQDWHSARARLVDTEALMVARRVLGALGRLLQVTARPVPALWLLLAALGLGLIGNIVYAVAPQHRVAASMMFMAAFVALGLFGLEPSATQIAQPPAHGGHRCGEPRRLQHAATPTGWPRTLTSNSKPLPTGYTHEV